MIRKLNASQQGTHSQQQKYPKRVVSKTQSHPTRNASSVEDESDELHGLARILRNTENSAVTASRGNDLSDQTQNKEVKKEDTATETLEKEQDKSSHLRCFPALNRRLIIYKSFYFFFFSAVGSLFPYLAVFYKQLWLSAQETGILIGIRPLIQLLGTPMWGVIADTYKKSKLIFMVSLVAWLVSNYSLSLVSPVFHLSSCKDNATIAMVNEIMEVLKNRTISVNNTTFSNLKKQKPHISVNTGKGSEHWFEIVGKVKKSNSTRKTNLHRPTRQNQNATLKTMRRSKEYNNVFRKSIGKFYTLYRSRKLERIDSSPENNVRQRMRRHIESLEFSVTVNTVLKSLNNQLKNADKLVSVVRLRRLNAISKDMVSESDLEKLFHNSSVVNIEQLASQVNREQIERVFDSLNMAGEYPWPLDTVANYELTQGSYDWQTPYDTHLFTILFVITAIGTLIAAPAVTLADTATLQNLGSRPEDYGKQRLWGTFGWGLAAFIVGSSLSAIEEINNCNNPLSVDYLPCFYAFACLMGVALLIGALFEFDEKESQETDTWQGLRTLIDCQYVYFILTILFCGIALGFIQTFLFWHLEDLGGSQFLFSTITAIHCISEVMVYSFSGFFIKHFGHHRVLYVGLSCYIIRFFGYALITNSWIVLPFEILHGLSTAAVWSAAVVFVGLIPGASATMQGILGGVHWGLGNGGGGVVGGLLITYAGTTTSFLIFGVVSLVDLSLFVCLNNIKYFNCFQWSKEVGTRSQYTLQEDNVDEDEATEYDDLY